MRKFTRLAIIGGSAALAMALSGTALAAYTPKLDVSVPNSLGAGGKTVVHFSVGPTDDTTARLVAYAPKGFTANPGTPGTTIGTVDAKVRAGDLGGAIVPVPGTIDVRDASGTALIGGVPVPLSTLAVGCTGTATHTAFWVLKLNAAGSSLELASFFDQTTGAEAALGSSKLTFCLPPDDVPPGTPGRSPLGIKLVDALLTFTNTYTNAASTGTYLWSSIWTPYNPGVGTANVAGTVTAVSVTPLPIALTLKGSFNKKTKSAALAGKITIAGEFVKGVKLPLFSGAKQAGLKQTGSTGGTTATGVFAAVKKMVKTTYYQVRFGIPAVDSPSLCAALPAVGLPKCVSASVGGFSVLSNIVKVTFKK
jgi:hypothetical protein